MAPENSDILSLECSIVQNEDLIMDYDILNEILKKEFPSQIKKDLKRIDSQLKSARKNKRNNPVLYSLGYDYGLDGLLKPLKVKRNTDAPNLFYETLNKVFKPLKIDENIEIPRLFYRIEENNLIQMVKITGEQFSSILPVGDIEKLASGLGGNWVIIENVPNFSNGGVSNECIFNALSYMENEDNTINILRERYQDKNSNEYHTDYYLLTGCQLTKEEGSSSCLALSVLDNLGKDNNLKG